MYSAGLHARTGDGTSSPRAVLQREKVRETKHQAAMIWSNVTQVVLKKWSINCDLIMQLIQNSVQVVWHTIQPLELRQIYKPILFVTKLYDTLYFTTRHRTQTVSLPIQ